MPLTMFAAGTVAEPAAPLTNSAAFVGFDPRLSVTGVLAVVTMLPFASTTATWIVWSVPAAKVFDGKSWTNTRRFAVPGLTAKSADSTPFGCDVALGLLALIE